MKYLTDLFQWMQQTNTTKRKEAKKKSEDDYNLRLRLNMNSMNNILTAGILHDDAKKILRGIMDIGYHIHQFNPPFKEDQSTIKKEVKLLKHWDSTIPWEIIFNEKYDTPEEPLTSSNRHQVAAPLKKVVQLQLCFDAVVEALLSQLKGTGFESHICLGLSPVNHNVTFLTWISPLFRG
ncbi:hypothetical protein BC833DRAFT_662896 [Globomyces pollinis-pini]|nr:hypothetical protein BC833DRAFT_662896 [Globomyces pollinis-pini]